MTTSNPDLDRKIAAMDDELLPVPKHRLHGPGHFLGLYGAEHVAATEFVIGAAFVAMGASINDILIGLLIGNTLAVLSFWLITARVAVKTRLSLYTYLDQNMGEKFSRFYNGANVLIFVAISAAMITVSATAVRALFDIPPQVYPYPTNLYFALIAATASVIAVTVAYYGFNVVAEFATICTPWLMVMFTAGGMVLIPALNESLTGYTTLGGFSDFVSLAGTSVFTGINSDGQPGSDRLCLGGEHLRAFWPHRHGAPALREETDLWPVYRNRYAVRPLHRLDFCGPDGGSDGVDHEIKYRSS